MSSGILQLSNELLLEIAEHLLSESDVLNLSQVCRGFQNVLGECYHPAELPAPGAPSIVHYACLNNPRLAVVKLAERLLRMGADTNAQTKAGWQPLHVAAYCGALTMLRLLLLYFDADPNAVNEEGKTPFWYAVSNEHVALIQPLLEAGGDPAMSGAKGISALDFVICNRHHGMLAEILKTWKGDRDHSSWSPLHSAAEANDTVAINALLEANYDVDRKTLEGETPLHEAVRLLHLEAAEILVTNGACPSCRDSNKRNAFHYLAENSQRPPQRMALFNLLVAKETDCKRSFSRQDASNRMTPLHYAALRGDLEMVSQMFAHGARAGDVQIDSDLGTPLNCAILSANKALVFFLVKCRGFKVSESRFLQHWDPLYRGVTQHSGESSITHHFRSLESIDALQAMGRSERKPIVPQGLRRRRGRIEVVERNLGWPKRQ